MGHFDDGSEELCLAVSVAGQDPAFIRLEDALLFAYLETHDLEAYYHVTESIRMLLERRIVVGVEA